MNVESVIPVGQTVVSLADKLPVMVVLVGIDSRIIFANEAFAHWVGARREDLIGDTFDDIMGQPPEFIDAKECRAERLARVAAVGAEETYEVAALHPTTGQQHMLCVKLVGHENQKCVYTFIEDITEQRLARRAEAQYRAVVDTAGEGVIVMDQVGTISSFNRSAEGMFGYKSHEVIGKNIKLLMPEKYAKHHDGYLQRYAQTREPRIVGRGGVRAECLRKDGSIFPAELAVAEMSVNEELHYTGIVRDVTERVEFEQQLREMNENLEAEVARRGSVIDQIFNLSTDMFVVCNADGVFETVSPAFERVTGIKPEEATSKVFTDFLHPDDVEGALKVFERLLQGENIEGYENRYRNIDGTYRWLAWSVTKQAETSQLYCVARDVTDEKIREEALRQSQKMEAIGQLTGGIAHDFNNLLMGISGSLDLIVRKLPEEERAKLSRYLDGAQGSAKRAAALTHRLLAFSRRQPLAPVTVNVNALVEGMNALIERTIGKEYEVVTSLGDVWPTLCDPHQLENGLLNLFLNARDAMSTGGAIQVKTLNIRPEDCQSRNIPAGEYVKIAVQDSGTGIDEVTLSKVFDPFFTTKPIGQGTGLGLSMLYGFVHQSGGHVRIASKVGRGTEVMIYLPRAQAEEDGGEAVSLGDGSVINASTARVLVVEDEEVIRNLVTDVLEGVGYECLAAGEGNEALKMVSNPKERIDLMISDVGLPGLNGKQLAELTRAVRPELKILFITGYAAGVTLRNDLLLDGTDMLLKPFTMDTLQTKVAEMLTNRRESSA